MANTFRASDAHIMLPYVTTPLWLVVLPRFIEGAHTYIPIQEEARVSLRRDTVCLSSSRSILDASRHTSFGMGGRISRGWFKSHGRKVHSPSAVLASTLIAKWVPPSFHLVGFQLVYVDSINDTKFEVSHHRAELLSFDLFLREAWSYSLFWLGEDPDKHSGPSEHIHTVTQTQQQRAQTGTQLCILLTSKTHCMCYTCVHSVPSYYIAR